MLPLVTDIVSFPLVTCEFSFKFYNVTTNNDLAKDNAYHTISVEIVAIECLVMHDAQVH